MNRKDPEGVFLNSFGRRIKKIGTKVDNDPRVVRCAMLDYCFCAKNGDCGDNQICTTLPGYNYTVCKTKNEIPINFFPKIILPNATDIFSFLGAEAVALATALNGECTLQSLIHALGSTLGNTFKQFLIGLGGQITDIGESVLSNGFDIIKNLIPG